MQVLVDTSVWSLALRKKTLTRNESSLVKELSELIKEQRVEIIGPIRQEVLSGMSDEKKFAILKEKLSAFEDLYLSSSHYETAAEFSNRCRKKGIQGSHTDFLICAAAAGNGMSIFTTDQDFYHYRDYIDIHIHTVRKEL